LSLVKNVFVLTTKRASTLLKTNIKTHKMKKIKLLFMLFASAFVIQAQTSIVVTGTIYDAQANTVANHPVIVIDSSSNTLVPPAVYNYITDANGVYSDSIVLNGQSGVLHFLTLDSCGLKQSSLGYNTSSGTNIYSVGFVLCNNTAATQNKIQISCNVFDSLGNGIANQPVIVVDSSSSASSPVIYTYITNANGTFTDSITPSGPTGSLYFITTDSCTTQTVVLSYTPNTTSLPTAGFVLCSSGGGSSNCNYVVNALPVAGIPNMAFFTFNGQSGSTYLWDFGDGNTSSAPNDFHTYAQPGTYYYCLTIDSCPPVCDSITVIGSGGCDPFFFPSVNGNTVDIFPSLLTGQFEVIIDWGDAQVDTFTPQNIPNLPATITHTYATPGSYSICLTHSNAALGCSNTHCDSVLVGPGSPLQCNAEFVVDTVNSQPGTVIVWNTSSVTGSSPAANVNFLWDFGDSTTSSQPFPTHTYQDPGTYVLCLGLTVIDSTATGPITCTDWHCDTLTVDQNGNLIYKGTIIGWSLVILDPATIGLEEDVFSGFNLYPNPATNYMVIDVPVEAESVNMDLINMTGQVVDNQTLDAGTKNEIDINRLSAGIYFVRLQSNAQTKTFKLIKQ
jgi:PKD repeat protein